MTGQFNEFALKISNVMHRFQADQHDLNAVWRLIENGKINPTVNVLLGVMPATASYSSLEEDCSS